VALVKAVGGNAHGYVCDITKKEQVYMAAAQVKTTVGIVSVIYSKSKFKTARSQSSAIYPYRNSPNHLYYTILPLT